MKLNLTEEQKKAALEAGKQGMKNAYEKSKYRPGLTWWERLCGVLPPFRLRAYHRRDCGADGDMQGWRLPGAGTGSPVLFPGPAGDGGTACDPENPERQMIPCRPVRNLPGQAVLHEPSRRELRK